MNRTKDLWTASRVGFSSPCLLEHGPDYLGPLGLGHDPGDERRVGQQPGYHLSLFGRFHLGRRGHGEKGLK